MAVKPLFVLTILCCVIAVTSVLAMLVDIWQCADLLSNNQYLWDLLHYSVPDKRLEYSLYLLLCLSILGPILLVCDRFSRDNQNEATMCSSSVQVLSMVAGVGLLLGHMTCAILVGSYKSSMEPSLRPALLNQLANHTYMMREPHARWVYMQTGQRINYMQTKFSCCGIDTYNDYVTHRFPERHENEPLPFSCCHLKDTALWHDPDPSDVKDLFLCHNKNPNAFHSKPCLPELNHWITSKANFVLGFSLTLFLLVLAWLILTVYVIYSMSGKPF